MKLNEIASYVDEGELTPRFVKIVIALTVAFLVTGGVFTYIVTFVILGF